MSAFQVVASVLLLTLAVLGAPPQDVQKKENADIVPPKITTQAPNSSKDDLNKNPVPAQEREQQFNVTNPDIKSVIDSLRNAWNEFLKDSSIDAQKFLDDMNKLISSQGSSKPNNVFEAIISHLFGTE
ncbi:hypothetical protein QAD02_010281 [Eretmocerus hayati]|uniref:Uncharacterized protein n=1 Tax=Eretmocerus hayati TaxID=131215 RepID=A0ACC2NC09_9HYME|nr:hypothetical protein QAD02_010281 [Eretmocerus hayati]